MRWSWRRRCASRATCRASTPRSGSAPSRGAPTRAWSMSRCSSFCWSACWRFSTRDPSGWRSSRARSAWSSAWSGNFRPSGCASCGPRPRRWRVSCAVTRHRQRVAKCVEAADRGPAAAGAAAAAPARSNARPRSCAARAAPAHAETPRHLPEKRQQYDRPLEKVAEGFRLPPHAHLSPLVRRPDGPHLRDRGHPAEAARGPGLRCHVRRGLLRQRRRESALVLRRPAAPLCPRRRPLDARRDAGDGGRAPLPARRPAEGRGQGRRLRQDRLVPAGGFARAGGRRRPLAPAAREGGAAASDLDLGGGVRPQALSRRQPGGLRARLRPLAPGPRDREATGYWWSPDGTRIAYYRFDERQVPLHPLVDQSPVHPQPKPQRYPLPGDPNPLVRVGVLDLAGGKTTWLETGAPDRYLARVAWTPAGDAVAIQALARSQARLDLLRCGAADGRCSTLLTDQWPTWVNLGKDFAFLPDGRFLWGSERDGWRRLYLAGADGKIVRPVSPEGWAVTSLDGVADDGSWAIFTAYRAQGLGPAERHVLRARLDQRLYQEAKWENLTVAAAENAAEVDPHTGAWVHSWSTADLPPRSEVRRADGSIVPLPWIPPSTFDPAALPPYTYFTIPGPDGSRLPARMIQPPGFDPARRYPVIVYQYGGPASQVVFRHWDARRRDLWHKRMAQRGYVIFSVDNQVSLFFGKAGEDRDHRRMGEANLAGQLAGIDWLKAQTWVDPSRIGLWGWSGGGYNTLYCLLNRTIPRGR